MNFFIDIEQFLSKKQLSFQQLILFGLFSFFAFFSIIFSLYEGNYFSLISLVVIGIICLSFSNEIKKIQSKTSLVSFQRDLIAGGFDASFFAFFIFSEGGKCLFINRIAQNLFPGFRIRNIEDFIICFSKYPQVVEAIKTLKQSAMNMKQSHIDVPMDLNSDNFALWRIAVSPIPDHNGFTSWSIVDLTPSTNKIDSLETNGTFLLDVLNHSNQGYICLSEIDEIIFCNKTFSYILGEKIQNIVNNPLSKYVIREKNLTEETPKFPADVPIKIKLKSSVSDNVEVLIKQILKNEQGLRVFSISRDVEQNDDLIQALGKTKLYFEHIFEDAPVGIVITDGAETISETNRTFRSLIKKEEVNKTSFLDYIVDDKKEAIREKLYQLIDTTSTSISPFEIKFKDQESKTIMIYVSKLDESKRTKDNDGLVLYFVDVTKQKELQSQFVQSQKMQAVGQLAGGIAHDFNNLLTAMIGYCDLLLEKYLPSDQSFSDIIQIKQNANRASNLVRQLLAFSRQQTMQPKVLSVTDMLSELSALLKRLLGAKIELKVVHSREVGYIKVDQIQFEQVIINLAVNARDAMKDGGTLSITSKAYITQEAKLLRGSSMPAGKYVLIEISDTGTGIEEKLLNRIFDPFFSTKEKGHGTGLGLSTVYGIVNQTGGFISVESEMGVGTKFSLYFPMISAEDVSAKAETENPTEKKNADLTGTGTILLVEDEDAVRMFSSRALRDKGYRIIEASNGESALEFIQKNATTIDLVITDVVMPKMDGPTLMEHIKELNPKMKIIFISGYTEDSFRNSLANNSQVHFLSKPFNLKELAGKVKEVMNS